MHIAPDTDIRILKDVPLDTTYDHTIYFLNAPAQASYFVGKTKYNLSDYSYQRVNRNFIRVGVKADNLYDCNYLMFRNTAFGNKWFYAFISSVEYVNNECSEITFEIDVMQTWFFDYQLDYCFVEREHVTSDLIGSNIVPEQVDCGEYVYNDYQVLEDISSMSIIIAVVDTEGEASKGSLYDGVYGGAALYAFNSSEVTGINNFLGQYLKNPDSVVGIYMCPKKIVGNYSGGTQIPQRSASLPILASVPLPTEDDTLDGYKPKNKKLYTYPYNYLAVDNTLGSEAAYRYEFFIPGASNTATFAIRGTVTPPVSVVARPTYYKGTRTKENFMETISIDSYPTCSWNTDAYKAWLAQNSVPLRMGLSSSMATGMVISSLTGNPIPMLTAGIGAVTNLISQGYKASIAADISKGNLNNGNVNIGQGVQNFNYGRKSITAQYARIIDNFFDVYGYAVKRVKLGNRNTRPHWNYLKTVSATITGSIPCDDMAKICSIYNNGITFWAKGDEVGHYELDNSI